MDKPRTGETNAGGLPIRPSAQTVGELEIRPAVQTPASISYDARTERFAPAARRGVAVGGYARLSGGSGYAGESPLGVRQGPALSGISPRHTRMTLAPRSCPSLPAAARNWPSGLKAATT